MTVRWGRLRRATQVAAAALYVAVPLANARGARGVLGSLASTALGPLDLVEPAAALSAALAGGLATPLGDLLLATAPPLLLAVALGPVFCSWVCPFGLVSEGIDALRARLRPRPWPEGGAPARRARAVVLAALLAASALAAVPLPAILQGPRAVSVAALEGIYLGAVSPFAAAVLGLLLALDVLLPRRLFCRALCPAGAVAALVRTRGTLAVAFDPGACRCAQRPPCLDACRWAVDPRATCPNGDCTNCLACVDACPAGALHPASPLSLTRRTSPTVKELR